MNKRLWIFLVGFCLLPSVAAGQMINANVLYSVDIGGDLDLSDPLSQANNGMDCGDIYLTQPSFPLYPPMVDPLIQGNQGLPGVTNPWIVYKDDTGPTQWWAGYPFDPTLQETAPQPGPQQIGNDNVGSYAEYFDLDAEDQFSTVLDGVDLIPDPVEGELMQIRPLTPLEQARTGLYHMPGQVYLSFDDDTPAGWTRSPASVPTTSLPDHVYEVWADRLYLNPPAAAVPAPMPWADEHNLGLSPKPDGTEGDQTNDDDVDALDLHPDDMPRDDWPDHIYDMRLWSADHEANYGLDPGSIYLTQNTLGPNRTLVLQQALHLGLPDTPEQDPDVDAFELLTITPQAYEAIFGFQPLDGSGAPILQDLLVAILSVDQDDPDTSLVDESGGLDPRVVYLSDLAGNLQAVSKPYEGDIDALSVPEPCTLMLLGVGGLAALTRKRRR